MSDSKPRFSATEFAKALSALDEAITFNRDCKDELTFKISRDAAIQRFEFSIELAWKTAAKYLGSSSSTAKPVIREMAQNQLITDPDEWFAYIEARDKTSHSYNERVAEEVFRSAAAFAISGRALLTKLQIP